jgi:DNA-directed RNA polymerase specialized sigma24 family protein
MELTSENFIRLLGWLDSNPDEAGQAYVRIKTDLTRKFTSWGCTCPDGLADITVDRVASILTQETIDNWQGDKQRKFYRVAYYVLLEYRAKKVEEQELPLDLPTKVVDRDEELETERELDCLDKCIEKLSAMKQELITKYYRGKKAIKIKNRKELARKLNMELPVLRVQALRIRKDLKTCIEECLETAKGNSQRVVRS